MSLFDKKVDGKIYILSSIKCEKFYIGSTTVTLEERLQRHIESYEDWLKNNFETGYISSFEILKYNEYEIKLLEHCPDQTGWYLLEREQYHQILNYKNIVNIIIPGKDVSKKFVVPCDHIYTCSCGITMLNKYQVRRTHSLGIVHRQRIRELHVRGRESNFKLDFEEKVSVFYGKKGITLILN